MTPTDHLKSPAKSEAETPTTSPKRLLFRINSASAGTFPRRLFGKKSEAVTSPSSSLTSSPIVEETPEFSIYLNRRIKIKHDGYLRGEEGDRIVVKRRVAMSLFVGVNGEQQGLIMGSSLELDHHSENVYLSTMDVLIEHPQLMITLLSQEFEGCPDHLLQLVNLLLARRLLLPALQKLCKLECQQMSAVGTDHVIFRDESPAVKMITSVLKNSSESLHKFYDDFTRFLVTLLEDRDELDSGFLASLLRQSIEYFNRDLPPILIMILGAIKSAGEGSMNPNKCSRLMGGIFFLRCICPALSQNQPKQKDNLKLIAYALLKISNHEDPSNEKLIPIQTQMRDLRPAVDRLFERMTAMMPLSMGHPSSLIRTAASFYRLVMREFEKHPDEDIRCSLAKLKLYLGTIPEDVHSEEELPMWNDIRQIRGLRVGEEPLLQGTTQFGK